MDGEDWESQLFGRDDPDLKNPFVGDVFRFKPINFFFNWPNNFRDPYGVFGRIVYPRIKAYL